MNLTYDKLLSNFAFNCNLRHYNVDPALDGLTVRADKFRLRQALINVTSNSIKYTREGGEVRVKVTCVRDQDHVHEAHLRHSPQGGGDGERSGGGPDGGPSWGRGKGGEGHYDEISARLPPGFVVQFQVIDNGIGIAHDKLGVIFMPFGQASISSTREYGGTG